MLLLLFLLLLLLLLLLLHVACGRGLCQKVSNKNFQQPPHPFGQALAQIQLICQHTNNNKHQLLENKTGKNGKTAKVTTVKQINNAKPKKKREREMGNVKICASVGGRPRAVSAAAVYIAKSIEVQ